jgi:hypothetical protein
MGIFFMNFNENTNSIVIANIVGEPIDYELIKKIRYNVEKAGYQVTEEYNGDVVALVWNKPQPKIQR